MSPRTTFSKAFTAVSTLSGIELTAKKPAAQINEFETNLTNDVDALNAIGVHARAFTGITQLYTASAGWGTSFADRAAAALAIGLYSQTVVTILTPGVTSRRHHWAPVCFTRRFRKQGKNRVTRGTPMTAFDPASDEVTEIPQVDLILPCTRKKGYNTQALEAFFSMLETGYTRVMAHDITDEAQAEFILALFAIVQDVRMPRGESNPPRTAAEFASAILKRLDRNLTPTVHRLDEPVGFAVENYFRVLETKRGPLYVAPVSRRVAVVFATNFAKGSSSRIAAARGLSVRQNAGARHNGSLIIGTPNYSQAEAASEVSSEDARLVD